MNTLEIANSEALKYPYIPAIAQASFPAKSGLFTKVRQSPKKPLF
jgi:hypothetical protein